MDDNEIVYNRIVNIYIVIILIMVVLDSFFPVYRILFGVVASAAAVGLIINYFRNLWKTKKETK
jgi:uncharacterized membrane protein YraQ (UPF0718 family)